MFCENCGQRVADNAPPCQYPRQPIVINVPSTLQAQTRPRALAALRRARWGLPFIGYGERKSLGQS
jgi:hypothetical protein